MRIAVIVLSVNVATFLPSSLSCLSFAAGPVNLHDSTTKPVLTAIKGIDGKTYRMDDGKYRASAIVFVAHDCPISNAYAPEINRIVNKYGSKRVQFFIVYTEKGLEAQGARKHAREYGFRCPIALDSRHEIAKKAQVTVTPEAIVLDSKGRRSYRGRIDDLYVEIGTRRYEATRHDLRLALDAIVSGRQVANPITRAVGCYIPTK